MVDRISMASSKTKGKKLTLDQKQYNTAVGDLMQFSELELIMQIAVIFRFAFKTLYFSITSYCLTSYCFEKCNAFCRQVCLLL